MTVKCLVISGELILNMFRGEHTPYRVIADAIPEGAHIVNVRHGWPDTIEILLMSDKFDDVPEGQQIPYITPMMESLAKIEHS